MAVSKSKADDLYKIARNELIRDMEKKSANNTSIKSANNTSIKFAVELITSVFLVNLSNKHKFTDVQMKKLLEGVERTLLDVLEGKVTYEYLKNVCREDFGIS